MRTLLFCWELGANLGHLVPMASVARAVRAPDLRIVYAVRDIGYARLALGAEAEVLQAPFWPHHRHFGSTGELSSFADVLTTVGFGDETKLAAMVGAWRALIDLVRPDCIVADHSPALLLTLFGGPVPVVAIGSPFTMPPLDYDRFPPLRGDRAPAVPENRLLDVVRRVQTARRAPLPSSLQEVFRTKARLVLGLPELDPYRAFRSEVIAMPPEGLPKPQEPAEETRLFAYLGGEVPRLEALVQMLGTMGVRVEAYLRGEVGPLPDFLRMRGATVHDLPPPLADVLRRASHMLGQGGAYSSAAALAAGRPQLILPLHEETRSNATMLEQIGVARRLDITADPLVMRKAVEAFLTNQDLVAAARGQAARIAARGQPDGRQLALNAISAGLG